MRDDPTVIALVTRARDGDQQAWDEIVERFAPLVWSLCRRHGLSKADAEDVGANVWLRLVERLDTIRDPAALAGWLATITRRECVNSLRVTTRETPLPDDAPMAAEIPTSEEWLLRQERHIALRAGFAELSDQCRELLELLFADPPSPYATISRKLDIPVGGIGPNRQRCLEKLRRTEALTALMSPEGR
ncbi:MAG TPA: sigma-70 family RNA polymerase sigma factor [Pseudonocardiaceae bacterium]|nr:sigma-70 family RNA polymerase sigma factor [Pseudonocardiaceae bacterium]